MEVGSRGECSNAPVLWVLTYESYCERWASVARVLLGQLERTCRLTVAVIVMPGVRMVSCYNNVNVHLLLEIVGSLTAVSIRLILLLARLIRVLPVNRNSWTCSVLRWLVLVLNRWLILENGVCIAIWLQILELTTTMV